MRSRKILIALLVLAAILRVAWAYPIPLEGDEMVSLLMATGNAIRYNDNQFLHGTFPLESAKNFLTYSEKSTPKNIFLSLKHAAQPHPPLYYLFLNQLLRFGGNEALFLRMTSVIFSLIALLFLFLAVKMIDREETAFYTCLFMGISVYGVQFSPLVRPYPLTALFAAVSTYLACKLARCQCASFPNRLFGLYALTVLLGFYTLYHFMFVFIFQISFLALSHAHSRKKLILLLLLPLMFFLCYHPWLETLRAQLHYLARHPSYYHTGQLIPIIKDPCYLYPNFISGLAPMISPQSKFILFWAFVGIFFAGMGLLFREKKIRAWVIATGIYFGTYYLADIIMGTRTLDVPKIAFFSVFLSLMAIASVASRLPERHRIKESVLIFLCFLLLSGTVHPFSKPRLFDQNHLIEFPPRIHRHLSNHVKGLLLFNSPQRRYFFSMTLALKFPLDFKVLDRSKTLKDIARLGSLEHYDKIFVIHFVIPDIPKSRLSPEEMTALDAELRINGFLPEDTYTAAGKSFMMIYGKANPAVQDGLRPPASNPRKPL